MAPSSFSLLLLRHLSAAHRRRLHHRNLSSSSLSSRLSYVFEKIDEIEKDRSLQDDALHRIRSWRESKQIRQPPHPPPPSPSSPPSLPSSGDYADNSDELGLGLGLGFEDRNNAIATVEEGKKREIAVVHPWPEWVALMERLLKQNYFDNRRVLEDQLIGNLGEFAADDDNNNNVAKFKEGNEEINDNVDVDEVEVDFLRDIKCVRDAMLNLGRDRFDILRSLSKQDIQILVGYGCASTERRLVFSSKLLRKYAHLDEGDVCSSCSLRKSCTRAYLVSKEDDAKTGDVMRVLSTYGFDPINGAVKNKSLTKQKTLKAVVRKLLRDVVRLSAVPIDPNLPPPLIKQRPVKVKQPPPPPKKKVGRNDIEMKTGDWLCSKCNFMNFAKNTICLQCDAKRPKRQLLEGEWECPQCDFLNYRRNLTCFNCESNRPRDGYIVDKAQSRVNRPPVRREMAPGREQVSNAWNFDFDDAESDGADVATFENADFHTRSEDSHLDSPPDGNFSTSQEDNRPGLISKFPEKEHSGPNVGFDDFDEDDDVDNYEVDNQHRNGRRGTSAVNFSDVENEDYSESENGDDFIRFKGRNSNSPPKSLKALHRKRASSDNEDEDLPVHPKWRSSHVANSGPSGSFDEDDDDSLVFGNDNHRDKGFARKQGRGAGDDRRDNYRDKGFSQKQGRGNFRDSDTRGFREVNGRDDGSISRQSRGNFRDSNASEFSEDDEPNSNGSRDGFRGHQDGRSVNTNRGRGGFGRSQRESYDGRGGRGSGRSESYDGRSGRGSGRSQRGSFDRGMQNSSRPGRGAGDRGHRRSDKTDDWSDPDSNRPLRQRRNV